jgi:carbon-monoxide dehydrogenase medium subunit
MKASAFSYARATSVSNAIELLVAHGERAKVLAGGQSLMPAMNLRLLAPEWIVDIGGLSEELHGISVNGDRVTIGALTRHADLLKSVEVAAHAPLLAEATGQIAHPAIRNRGTIGGSLAHADPASELPACVVALDATIIARGPAGERRIPATEFFTGVYETALATRELLVAVELPPVSRNSAHFFGELARRHGDYAIVGLAAQAIVENDRLNELRTVFFGVSDRPQPAKATASLIKTAVTPASLSQTMKALGEELDPPEDHQANGAMRRHLAKVLLAQCISKLLDRPELGAGGRP